MRSVELIQVEHNVKIGDVCGDIEPNITEDTIFTVDGEPVGFYLKSISGKLLQYIEIANAELLSNRVPKMVMNRTSGEQGLTEKVKQFSTIIGSVPARPHMRRPYPSISSVHQEKSAQTFIKAMLLACKEAENVIQEITPTIFEKQKAIIEEKVPPKYRFGRLFTSSISNFNISAAFHRDAGNLEGCVNVIIAKKSHAKGGNTTVPDYSATMDSCDNSMLVYPAWRNVHGVTPIIPLREGGYRNSIVFYPLKAFNNAWDK
ncbi:hypothetical protein UFOVP11_41 [uncultured Caudovirales phage]|uniref:2OGFeDO, oxygenase domain containing protein n=1 Tax=uncultured Caudovirales phage TaxID=2100421 RepID=A0A6J5KHG0_9CAUD|nr:hypothetical protein UFOVP11_41 [uncultured Caudovirales phage]